MLLRDFVSSLTFAAFVAVVSTPAAAQVSGAGLKELLAKASDSALDQLAKPGAFSADDAIRIGLPGSAKGLGDLMKFANKAGLTGDIDGSLNRAAEQAAGAAKPIFRSAIDKLTMRDAMGIAGGGKTGATDYLRKNTGTEITRKLLPLVRAALEKTGVFKQASQLSALGMDEAKLSDYVSKKTADGIFTYVGREETRMRQDPLGTGQDLLKGLKF